MVKPKRILSLILRLLAVGASLSAAIVMATSRERASLFALSFEAKYSDIPALVYFVIANSIAAVYGFLVLFLPPESVLWGIVVALDLVITLLLTSSISAALAIAQVGKNGNSHAGWLPICGQVPKYCEQTTGALAAGFAAILIYVLLILWSIHPIINPSFV